MTRVIEGLDFLEHTLATLDCGNEMWVQFMEYDIPDQVLAVERIYDTPSENAVLFMIKDRLRGHILIEDMADFVFIQEKIQMPWVAKNVKAKESTEMPPIIKSSPEFFQMVRYYFDHPCFRQVRIFIPDSEDLVGQIGSLTYDGKSAIVTFKGMNRSFVFFDPNDWEFQYHPGSFHEQGYYIPRQKTVSTEGKKVHSISEMQSVFLESTFTDMKPVTLYTQQKFWTVMAINKSLAKDDKWFLFLKDKHGDSMTRLTIRENQEFVYEPGDKSFRLTKDVKETTDPTEIKSVLRGEDVSTVIVSGEPMDLVKCAEIDSGVIFLVFLEKKDPRSKRYYYLKKTSKLRVFTDHDTNKKEYRLDHVRAMHIG